MSLIISTGTNLGEREKSLERAKKELSTYFDLMEYSRVYSSSAVDYFDQPDFLNQVLAFKLPSTSPTQTIRKVLEIETELGRIRNIPKGPRIIDIDILFWGKERIEEPELQVPHPRLFERSFIVLPLKELEIFNELNKDFDFPNTFSNEAIPYLAE